MSDKRLKASDVAAQQKHLLGDKVTFSQAFPEIESVTVEGYETDYGFEIGKCFWSTGYGEFLDCKNPQCYNGGVNIGQQIRFMLSVKETNREKMFYCQGYEGSPKGRIKRGMCAHRFHLKINIKYKPNESDTSADENVSK